ncbi:MAG: phosphonopyruvate decarboxylase, partial [Deltaproteobacteria bacterium]
MGDPMVTPEQLYQWLAALGVDFYAGVPDSLLKAFCAYVTDHAPPGRHVITGNEGGAIALAMGYHLATGRIGAVYLQNSGLGNAVNPLTSLADPAIYGVPMLLVIGWRGEPGHKDEPQHVQMGQVTRATLEAIGVPHTVLPAEPGDAEAAVKAALADVVERQAAHALVIRKGTFESYALQTKVAQPYQTTREHAIEQLVASLPNDAVVVSTTGKPSRELFEVRKRRGEPHQDFLTVGGMGHASQIALGLAMECPNRSVYCLDGDGAVLMHLGGLATIATVAPANYKHVVVNNG